MSSLRLWYNSSRGNNPLYAALTQTATIQNGWKLRKEESKMKRIFVIMLCTLLAHVPNLYTVQAWQDTENPALYVDEYGEEMEI